MAKAVLIQKSRAYVRDGAFIEILIWRVPEPVEGSRHLHKYSLALVHDSTCVLRFDNEAGKGDHWHLGTRELPYVFSSMDALMDDFLAAVKGWLDEYPDGEDRDS